MRTCLRQAPRQVSELFGNPAFGRSSSHGDLGPHRPTAGPQGWGQEGPASAENQSWRMGQEERVVGLQLTTGTQGQPPSALQKDTGVTVRKDPARRRSPARDGAHLSRPGCILRETPAAAPSCPDAGLGLARGASRGQPRHGKPGQKHAGGLRSQGVLLETHPKPTAPGRFTATTQHHSDPPDPRHPQEDEASPCGAPMRLWHKARLEHPRPHPLRRAHGPAAPTSAGLWGDREALRSQGAQKGGGN